MKILSALLSFSLIGLSSLSFAAEPIAYQYKFAEGSQGWSAGFADYPAGQEEFYELYSGFEPLPAYFDQKNLVFYLSGNNHSADLCMFLRKSISGLQPDTRYRVQFQTTISSNATNSSFGIGSAQATSVYVKAGISLQRPAAAYNGNRPLNIDIGNQSSSGSDGLVLGNIGVDNTFDSMKYMYKTLSNAEPFYFTTDENGKAWLILAIDSGYESTTALFIKNFRAVFIPVDE